MGFLKKINQLLNKKKLQKKELLTNEEFISNYSFQYNNEKDNIVINAINTQTSTLEGYYRFKKRISIVDVDIYHENKFYVLGDNSEIYLGEVGISGLEELIAKQSSIYVGYYCDKTSQKLWIACEVEYNDENINVLQCWDLIKKECIQEIQIPNDLELETLVRRSDGCFIFYKSTRKENNGFYCINPKNEKIKYYELKSKALPKNYDDTRNMLFPHNRDIAVLPACDEFLSSSDEEGNILYNYQIQVINLNDFSVLERKTVRTFSVSEISSYYDDEKEIEKELNELVKNSDKYRFHKTTIKWLEFLDILTICNDENAFWLRWRDFSIIKVDFEGNILTPLYKLEEKEIFRIHNQRLRANKDELLITDETIVNDNKAYYYIDLKEEAKQSDGKLTLKAKNIEPKAVSLSSKYYEMVQEYGVNLIELKEFYNDESITQALDNLALKLQDIKSLAVDNKLIFEFIDQYGEIKVEENFISSSTIRNNLPIIKKIIEAFSKYEYSGDLVDAQGRPALTEIILYMFDDIDGNPEYYDILRAYFNTLNPNNAQYYVEEIIPNVQEHYAYLDSFSEFLNTLPKSFFTNKKETLNWF